jgi:hypothetical protein
MGALLPTPPKTPLERRAAFYHVMCMYASVNALRAHFGSAGVECCNEVEAAAFTHQVACDLVASRFHEKEQFMAWIIEGKHDAIMARYGELGLRDANEIRTRVLGVYT